MPTQDMGTEKPFPSPENKEKAQTYYGGVAQLGEHLPCKQGVMGSNPIISTMKRKFQKGDTLNDRTYGFEQRR